MRVCVRRVVNAHKRHVDGKRQKLTAQEGCNQKGPHSLVAQAAHTYLVEVVLVLLLLMVLVLPALLEQQQAMPTENTQGLEQCSRTC